MNVLLFVLLLMVPGILLAESQLQSELFFSVIFLPRRNPICGIQVVMSDFRFVMISSQVLFILCCWSFICKMERLNGYS